MSDTGREPFTLRLGRSRAARSVFLGIATVAAALGFPVKIERPPRPPTPVEVVRDEDETEPDAGRARRRRRPETVQG